MKRVPAQVAAVLAAWVAAAAPARAEQVEGFGLQVFSPSAAGDRFLAVPEAGVEGHLRADVKLGLSYGLRPLRLLDSQTDETLPNGSLVRHQLYLHLDAALAIADRVQVEVGLPFAAYQSGESPFPGGAIAGTALADGRVGARVALYGGAEEPLALAAAADLWLPMGSRADWAGDGSARFNPRLLASGRFHERWLWAANLGFLARSRQEARGLAELGNAITYGAAAGLLFANGLAQVGPELYGSTALASGASPIEAMLTGRRQIADFTIGAGVGTALTGAPGAAPLRVVASLAWSPGSAAASTDTDGDGIVDADDRCPTEKGIAATHGCAADRDADGIADGTDACPELAGVVSQDRAKHGCPADRDGDGVADVLDACPEAAGVADADRSKHGCPADRDADGVADAVDACPEVAGLASADRAKHGCPADRDADGVADAVDACPEVAGLASEDLARHGCPADRDADGVADAVDACPEVAGLASEEPAKNGCPAVAALQKEAIVISEQVHFELNRAELRPESEAVLRAVADILRGHPELVRVAIEGHTDDQGAAELNKTLSQQRAEAVRAWLVEKGGVEPGRLSAEGLGAERPISPNETAEGRARNRRVEFQLR